MDILYIGIGIILTTILAIYMEKDYEEVELHRKTKDEVV